MLSRIGPEQKTKMALSTGRTNYETGSEIRKDRHAGLDKPAPYHTIRGHPLPLWIPAFAGMTNIGIFNCRSNNGLFHQWIGKIASSVSSSGGGWRSMPRPAPCRSAGRRGVETGRIRRVKDWILRDHIAVDFASSIACLCLATVAKGMRRSAWQAFMSAWVMTSRSDIKPFNKAQSQIELINRGIPPERE